MKHNTSNLLSYSAKYNWITEAPSVKSPVYHCFPNTVTCSTICFRGKRYMLGM